MSYIDYSAAFAYKDLLTYQKLNQLGANDAYFKDTPTIAGLILGAGDLYSVAWTDYSASAEIVGWAAGATVKVYYKKIGKLIFVLYHFTGTSNSIYVTFNVPYTVGFGHNAFALTKAQDNGGAFTIGDVRIYTGGVAINIYKNIVGDAWTNIGDKQVFGQFWYEAA